jgi:hypothetical protein
MDIQKVKSLSDLSKRAFDLSLRFEEEAAQAIGQPINTLTAEQCCELYFAMVNGYYHSEILNRLSELVGRDSVNKYLRANKPGN